MSGRRKPLDLNALALSQFLTPELVKGWWAMSCSDRQTAVYCDQVRNVLGLANYVTKNLKDRSKVEMPPQEWNGRKCRLVWRSRGFLTKSKEDLWKELRAKWYPQPAAEKVSFEQAAGVSFEQARSPSRCPSTTHSCPTGCCPAQEQVQHPAPPHMLPRLTAVGQHIGIMATGFFKSVGQHM